MVLSRDKDPIRGADALQDGGRQQGRAETKSTAGTLLARSKTHACHDKSIAREPGDPQLALPEMAPASSCEKPDEGMSRSRKPGKSDDFIVPKKSANKMGTARRHGAEQMEERRSAKGKICPSKPETDAESDQNRVNVSEADQGESNTTQRRTVHQPLQSLAGRPAEERILQIEAKIGPRGRRRDVGNV